MSKPTNRKPTQRSKKMDLRESFGPSSGDASNRLRGKASNNPPSSGTWKAGTLHLIEEDKDVKLQVISEEQSLHHSIDLRQLRSTHIRLVDKSRWAKSNVLAVYCSSNDGISSSSYTKPIYIHFASVEYLNTWLVLLRTYTTPETYGPLKDPVYRIWRQVHLNIITANNVGVIKTLSGDTHSPNEPNDGEQYESHATDMDLSCEIVLNDETVAFTETQNGIGKSSWWQSFIFSDLPALSSLHIDVYRTKRSKRILLGTAFIPVEDCHHGDTVEGWIAILSRGEGRDGHYIQVGDIKVKYKVEEEIILPQSQYQGILKIFDNRNMFDLVQELEQRLQLKTLSQHVTTIAIARDNFVEEIRRQAEKEIDGSPNSHTTLFRGNSVLTKALEKAMFHYGAAWLDKSIGEPLRMICEKKVSIETDPGKRPKGLKDQDQQIKLLVEWCRIVWHKIYAAREDCPTELRTIFCDVRTIVENKYTHEREAIQWTAVSAFLFLRFFVPAILQPHLHGLVSGLPPPPVTRTLTLIGKVIQSLANMQKDIQKEEHMRKAKDFITEELPSMADYLLGVSTLNAESRPGFQADLDTTQTDRLHIIQSISRQLSTLLPLHREAIPSLPHMIDVPQQLALITSLIVRNCKKIDGEVISNISGPAPSHVLAGIGEFVCQCLDIEALALQQVNSVARLEAEGQGVLVKHHRSTSSTVAAGVSNSNDMKPPVNTNVSNIALLSEPIPGKLIRKKQGNKVSDVKATEQDEAHPSQSSSSLMPLNASHRNEESGRSSPNASDPEFADGKRRKVPWGIFRK